MKYLSKKYISVSLFLLAFFAILVPVSVSAADSSEPCQHVNTIIVEASEGNCFEKGYTDGVFCEDCDSFISGHTETDYKHNEFNYRRIEPTCKDYGYTEGVYCDLCETFLSGHEEIPFAEHTKETHSAVDKTCTADGYTEGVFCSVCETYLSGHEVIPAAHTTITVHRQPETCTQNGYTEGVYCTACETYLSGHEVIPAGHVETYVPAKPATCTGNGYTEGLYCTVCGEYTEGHRDIPFTDHSFTEKVTDNRHLVSPATVRSPAVYRYDCVTCNKMSDTLTYTYGEKIPVGATTKIVAAQSTSAIRLTWQYVGGADGYRIYYYNNSAKAWKAVKDVKDTTITFTGLVSATAFKFAVRAFTVDGGKKNLSYKYTTIETATKPVAPSKIAAAQNSSAIKLAWTAVKGASGYRIYYKSGNSWKVCVSTTTETSHIFTGLPAGKSYIFAVRPYVVFSSGVVLGEYKTYLASTVPAKVKATAVSQAPRHITLTWGAVNADAYQVYYKNGNGAYKLYKAYSTPQKLIFSGLKSGAKYTFAVRAVKKTSAGYLCGEYTPVSVTVR